MTTTLTWPFSSTHRSTKAALFVSALTLFATLSGCGTSRDEKAHSPDSSPLPVPSAASLTKAAPASALSNQLLADAQQALSQSRFEEALKLASSIPVDAQEWQAATLVAGEAATRLDRMDEAYAWYERSFEKQPATDDGLLAMFSAGEIRLEQCRLVEAEQLYRRVLERQPGSGLTNERMAFLLSATGRRWESLNHYFVLTQSGTATHRELALAADVNRAIEIPEFLSKCQRSHPNDLQVRAAIAFRAFTDGQQNAADLLADLVEDHGELIPIRAMLGEVLVERGDNRSFLEWLKALHKEAFRDPDVWFVCGLWSRRQGDLDAARTCFARATAEMPFHRRAFSHLGQVLTVLNDPAAQETVDYANRLILLSQAVDQVLRSDGRDQAAVQQSATLLEDLGRLWEACAWGVLARQAFPEAEWPSDLFERHAAKLDASLPWVVPETLPKIELSEKQVAAFSTLVKRAEAKWGVAVTDQPKSHATIRFREADLVEFSYFNSDDPATKGIRTFEQTGGGVGIIDFDCDGLPDLFLPQGVDWETGSSTPSPLSARRDALFRNRWGRTWHDASRELPNEVGYGQGCAVGDVDNDGFPDLYVANVGRNAVLTNMGDGTFLDATDQAGIDDESWTASVMIRDLNADGVSDLFDVNYLKGDDVYQRICQGLACSPGVFPGAQDRVLVGDGAGGYSLDENATPANDAKGLGLVSFEPALNGRPSIFVANDQVANYLLAWNSGDRSHEVNYVEEASFAGLAFNDDGVPMACMGIALEDFDDNGLLDLFVTNFLDEPNTLYLQDTEGLYVDSTKSSGLYSASLSRTGWGTQAIDADLDGDADLIVTNGHVDDYRDQGGPYRMRPQFFENLGGRFTERSPQEVGSWFDLQFLGRGLARVDWNLDGREEFIVSNMNAPVSVLENVSEGAGNFIRVKLHGTNRARDAIGARVTVLGEDLERTKQLTAGDGYMASNHRVVTFGLGGRESLDSIQIAWPGGGTTTITDPKVNSFYELVEGSKRGLRWDRRVPAPCRVSTIRNSGRAKPSEAGR